MYGQPTWATFILSASLSSQATFLAKTLAFCIDSIMLISIEILVLLLYPPDLVQPTPLFPVTSAPLQYRANASFCIGSIGRKAKIRVGIPRCICPSLISRGWSSRKTLDVLGLTFDSSTRMAVRDQIVVR